MFTEDLTPTEEGEEVTTTVTATEVKVLRQEGETEVKVTKGVTAAGAEVLRRGVTPAEVRARLREVTAGKEVTIIEVRAPRRGVKIEVTVLLRRVITLTKEGRIVTTTKTVITIGVEETSIKIGD